MKRVLITGMSGTGKSTRTTNPFGKDPDQLARTLQLQQEVFPLTDARQGVD